MKKLQNINSLVCVSVFTLFLTACGGGGGGGDDGGGPPPPPPVTTDNDNDGVISTSDSDDNNPCIPDNSNASCTGEKDKVDDYFSTLPVWNDFAYANEPKRDVALEGTEQVDPDSINVFDTLDSNNQAKACTTEHVSFFDTPSDYVMFSAPGHFYPGALVQGKTLRDGAGPTDILPLNIAQRNKVNVSIPACAFAGNFEETEPTQAGVASAIGAIINRAKNANVDCINAQGSLEVETYNSEQHRALKAKVSGRYFGFSGSAGGSYSKDTTENSIAVVFKETLFTVRIQAPQTPNEWFSDEFTSDLLQQQVDLGRIGPDNVPAYVSEVTYGRMMMFTMTSEASTTAMQAYVNFKYKNPVGEVKAGLSAEEETAIQQAKYTAAYLGEGSGYQWLSDLDWTGYFGNDKTVTAADAVPISFTLNSTRDDVPAVVQEFTEFDRTTCIDKVAAGGTFNFLPKQTMTVNFPNGSAKELVTGDINGDGNFDLIWYSTLANSVGEFAIAFSNGDGTFAAPVYGDQINFFDTTGLYSDNLGTYKVMPADVDKDGRQDLVFNTYGQDGNRYAVAFYKNINGTDQFVYSMQHNVGQVGWTQYDATVAQFDGKLGTDIVWNARGTTNRSYIHTAVDMSDPSFDFENSPLFDPHPHIDHTEVGWSNYNYWHVGDFSGDGKEDFVWQHIGYHGNDIYAAKATDDIKLDFGNLGQRFSNWRNYTQVFRGDVTGDGRVDLIEPRVTVLAKDFGIYTERGSANPPYIVAGPYSQNVQSLQPDAGVLQLFPETLEPTNIYPTMYAADVDGNGLMDLIVTQKSSTRNDIAVGLANGNDSNYFDFSRKLQSHPDVSQGEWSQFKVYFANIDGGDGNRRSDMVMVNNADPVVIYTGLARAAE